MSLLVEQLVREHAHLVEILDQVRSSGIQTEKAQGILKEAKATLLGHIRKEDNELYPALQRRAETDEKLRSKLTAFASEMSSISKEAEEFFAKYSGGLDSKDFARDFARLYALLSKRISREESILYPEYDKFAR